MKRNDLRAKLQASDRRRARRPVAPATAPTTTTAQQHVAEQAAAEDAICQSLLACRDRHAIADRDAIVALRSLTKFGNPTTPPAVAIHHDLLQIQQRFADSPRTFRQAALAVLDQIVSVQNDNDSGDAFLLYLATLQN